MKSVSVLMVILSGITKLSEEERKKLFGSLYKVLVDEGLTTWDIVFDLEKRFLNLTKDVEALVSQGVSKENALLVALKDYPEFNKENII